MVDDDEVVELLNGNERTFSFMIFDDTNRQ